MRNIRFLLFLILFLVLSYLRLTPVTATGAATATPEPAKTFSPLSSVEVPRALKLPEIPAGLVLYQNQLTNFYLDKPKNDSLWADNQDGVYRKIELFHTGVLSPSGDRWAYFRGDDIWVMNLPDGSEKKYPDPNKWKKMDLMWSPDDSKIAFETHDENWEWDGNLSLLDLNTGEYKQIVNTTGKFFIPYYWPSVTPGTIFAGVGNIEVSVPGTVPRGWCHTSGGECNSFLSVFSIDGSKNEVLDKTTGIEFPPAITPDGKLLFYDGGTILHLDTGWIEKITPKNADIEIAFSYDSNEPQLVAPVISPDGKNVAWLGHVNDHGDNGIYIYNIETREWKLLATYFPQFVTMTLAPFQAWKRPSFKWSPDSGWLSISGMTMDPMESTFNSSKLITNGFLWIFNVVDGTTIRTSTGDLSLEEPVWSPDSKQIAFSQRFGRTVDLDKAFVMDISSKKISEIPVPIMTVPLAWR
jgi:Tol biopolymer transport system component